MEIKYDKNIDAKYIRIKKGKVSRTKRCKDWLLFDFAKNGDILGVEILEASKHPIGLSIINGDLIGSGMVESLNKFNNVKWKLGLKEEYNKNNLCFAPN